ATGKEQKITISNSSGLSKDEVDRLVKDAQGHAAEDQAKRTLIDARNQTDALVYQVEKTVAENRDRLPAADVAAVETALADAKAAAQGEDVSAINKAVDALQRASHAVAQKLYQGSQGSGSQGSNVKDAEVVDAEYAEAG